jgi:wobble nucleotide-excising tRNase
MFRSKDGLIAVAVIALIAGSTAAQETPAEVKATAPLPAAAPPPAPVVEVEQVPDEQKVGRSRELLDRMREVLTKVLKHLEEAREERDVIKLNCVNEKLTAVKGLLKISEQADVAMQEALARRNAEVSQHEFEKISIAGTKCEQLFAESEACVGELAVYAGDTQVVVEIEGEPPQDLSENIPEIEIVNRPPAASPYQ